MSSVNQIRILYGSEEVVTGPSGVDLSLFPNMTVEHPSPETANISDLKDWFIAMFQLDGNFYSVTIQCLYVTEINPVTYALRLADRTHKWKKWIGWCRRSNVPLTILVQPCAKEVVGEASSSQLVENESGFYGDVAFDQLEIRKEGGPQREEIESSWCS